jgi:hypothetical protein
MEGSPEELFLDISAQGGSPYMPVRRLAVSAALAIALVPGSGALADTSTSEHQGVQEAPATRADVLAGRASNAQELELLKSSIEAAGGTAVDDSAGMQASEGPETIGGTAYPLTAADLDGDGDEEILLRQYENKSFVIAADETGILWRQKLPSNSYIAGFLIEDLSASPGQDVVLVMYTWPLGPPPSGSGQTSFGIVDRFGLRWTFKAAAGWLDINGAVQADGDGQSELAITLWSDYGHPAIHTLDGESGTQVSRVRPTLEEQLPDAADFGSQAFITDGADGQADEAVFVTSVFGTYYAERRSLVDGTQLDYEIVQEPAPDLTQGPDYTGDGRRDAFAQFAGIGVFDPVTLSTRWISENPPNTGWATPYNPGDLNGDGGAELCAALEQYTFDPDDQGPNEYGARIKCHSGADGALLWENARSVVQPTGGDYNSAWVYTNPRSDLNGDGVVDPMLFTQSERCYEGENSFTCEKVSFEAVAFNGIGGAPLWTVNDTSQADMIWTLSEADLDGAAGDDFFDDNFYDEDEPSFVVRNGLTLQNSWEGYISPGMYGWTQGVGEADVDGDGDQEVAITAEVTGRSCHPQGCRSEQHTFLTIFEPGEDLLWQLEL